MGDGVKTFVVTGPDGKKYKVTGSDAQGAVAAVKKMLGMGPTMTAAEEQPQFASNGSPMNEAAKRALAERAKAGTLPRPAPTAEQSAMDQRVADEALLGAIPPGLGAVTSFNQGMPFIGEYSDEITGALDRMTGGTGAAGDTQRAVQDAMRRQRPGLAMAANIAGGVIGSAPLALAAGPAVLANAPASIGGRVMAGAAAGAVAGGVEGAVSGYGAGVGDTRMESAATRGAIGAGFGAGVGAAGPVIAEGTSAVLQWVKGRDYGVISRVLGISKDAAKVVKASLDADDPAAAAAALKRAGANAMLADAGPASAQMLDTAIQTSGAAARIARSPIEARAAAAATRLTGMMDNILGAPKGIRAGAREIATRTSVLRKEAYDRAYKAAVNYADDTGRAIESVLERIPTNTLTAAIAEANDAMREAGTRNMQIMAEIAPDGAVTFREMPNVLQLDEIKKALGTIARKETDAVTGRISAAGLRAKRLAGALSEAIAEAVPIYKTAVRLGGDKIAEDMAFDMGARLLSPTVTREAAAEVLAGASREAKAAAKVGLRSYIDDTLANIQRTITDANVDAREAMAVVKALSSRANVEKVRMILGPQADTLLRAVDEAAAHLELRSAVARNSATASRIAGQKAVDQITEPGAMGSLMQGKPFKAAEQVVSFLTGNTPEVRETQKQAIYAEIAGALTNLRGPQAERALRIVQSAMAGQRVTAAQAELVGRTLATVTGAAAYQSGVRYTTTPGRATGQQ